MEGKKGVKEGKYVIILVGKYVTTHTHKHTYTLTHKHTYTLTHTAFIESPPHNNYK